jgi:hypothetical protein
MMTGDAAFANGNNLNPLYQGNGRMNPLFQGGDQVVVEEGWQQDSIVVEDDGETAGSPQSDGSDLEMASVADLTVD